MYSCLFSWLVLIGAVVSLVLRGLVVVAVARLIVAVDVAAISKSNNKI